MDTTKCNVLSERRNRKEPSVAKSSLRVFTQPGPRADTANPANTRVGHASMPSSSRFTRRPAVFGHPESQAGHCEKRMESYADQRFKKGCRGFDPAELQA